MQGRTLHVAVAVRPDFAARTRAMPGLVAAEKSFRAMTAAEIAEKMEVAPRTIYRDMDHLIASGAPIVPVRLPPYCTGATPTQTIDLAGVDLATHYGVTPGAGGVVAGGHDTATIISGMLNDHSLKVDTV